MLKCLHKKADAETAAEQLFSQEVKVTVPLCLDGCWVVEFGFRMKMQSRDNGSLIKEAESGMLWERRARGDVW